MSELMRCPFCGAEMEPDLNHSGGWLREDTLPENFIADRVLRCTNRGPCGKPILLISGVWYKWVYHNGGDMYWEAFAPINAKPRKISSNFIGGKQVFQI